MRTTKRILFVITKANWGGAQRYVYDLALAAREAGNDVAVAYGQDGEMARRLEAEGIRTIAIGALKRDVERVSDYAAYEALRELFRSEKPDVVHLNSSKAAGLGALAARVEKVPRIIYTAHGWAFNESRPKWQKFVIRMLAGLTIYLAHKTICVSEAVRRDVQWLPFAGYKLVVIKNGIACGPLVAREEARAILLSGHATERWIGMVSELHPTKRIADAIEAFAHIQEAHPETILVIIGDGEERKKLEALIRAHKLESRIFLLGFIKDAARYLSAFDLFLHSSQSEAFAYAILEAGCASLPTVATRVGGIPEAIEDGVSGILVPPRAPLALAKALEDVLQDPGRGAPLGRALHERVRREFSQEKMIEKTLALYAKN